jgi:flagellar M-ring protein FliF
MATATLTPSTAGAFTPSGANNLPAAVSTSPATGSAMATTGNGGAISPANNPATVVNDFAGNTWLQFKVFAKTSLHDPKVRRYLPLVIAAIALVLLASLYTSMTAQTYRAVIPNMSEADKQAAFEALEVAKLQPRVDSSSGELQVSTDDYYRARIVLAAQGLPRAGVTGGMDSLKDQNAMTTSQFMEQVRVNSAIEQELSHTIGQIATVASARVHLAQPRQSVFVRDRVPPKASVVVSPYPGRVVAREQVQAIVHLVASSIPYLASENVTVVDTTGNLLTSSAQESSLGMTAAQTEHQQKLEETYRGRIEEILSPVVGAMNVRSQINLALDFTQIESTLENYDNAEKGPKTRSEVLAEDRSNRPDAAGVPGALSNVPPPNATATTNTAAGQQGSSQTAMSGTSSSRTTRNYELDRTVRHTKNAMGNVQRLTVAVVVNERPAPAPKEDETVDPNAPATVPFTEAELKRMEDLVRMVVGYDAQRGDVVTVVPTRFEAAPEMPKLPWYEDQAIMANAKTGVVAGLFALFLLTVIRPVVKHLIAPPLSEVSELAAAGELSEEDMRMIQLGDGESLEEIKAKLKPKKSSISMDMLDTANTYDDKVALVRMLVAEDTARVANVLKGMIRAV